MILRQQQHTTASNTDIRIHMISLSKPEQVSSYAVYIMAYYVTSSVV